MVVGCTLDLCYIIDLACRLLHRHRALFYTCFGLLCCMVNVALPALSEYLADDGSNYPTSNCLTIS